MCCDDARELLSADLDGELVGDERRLLDGHLAGCRGCRDFRERAGALHRAVRVRPADRVPDLVPAVMERARLRTRPSLATYSLRCTFAVLGAVQLAFGVYALTGARLLGPEFHVHHHVSGCAVAFGVGLLVVAVRPDRARALLPLAAALIVTTMMDLTDGGVAERLELPYVVEFVGLVLLGLLARTRAGASPPRRGPTGPGPQLRPSPA